MRMAKKKIRDMQPKREELIRTFWYPENAGTDATNGFKVMCSYMNPASLGEIEQQARTRIKQAGKILEDMAPKDARTLMLSEVLLQAIVKIEGMTYDKLRKLVPISADQVKEAGGPDAAVDMDPERGVDGRDNVLFLLEQCNRFSDWMAQVSGDIGRFQDSDWEVRSKNSVTGAESTSER